MLTSFNTNSLLNVCLSLLNLLGHVLLFTFIVSAEVFNPNGDLSWIKLHWIFTFSCSAFVLEKLISVEIVSSILFKLEDREKLDIIGTLFLSIELIVNLNGRSKLVIFIGEAVKSKMS